MDFMRVVLPWGGCLGDRSNVRFPAPPACFVGALLAGSQSRPFILGLKKAEFHWGLQGIGETENQTGVPCCCGKQPNPIC